MLYLCSVQPVLYLSPAALRAAPFGLGLLMQLFNPGLGALCFGAEGLQLPGERVLHLGFLQSVLGGLQDRPPPLLGVFHHLLSLLSRFLLQLLLLGQTLALSPQLRQLGVSLRLTAQDSLMIKTTITLLKLKLQSVLQTKEILLTSQ